MSSDRAPETGVEEIRPAKFIYEVYPASFNDSDGDGCGDLQGIIRKLDYIKSLHADGIWIAPFFLSPPGPEGDNGYAVSNYREISPRYGTMEDFEELLREAHKRGLEVYTDFVVAHTANDHEWFEKSRRREEPYANYYVWHDGKIENGKRVPPNNWKSLFGGSAWKWDDLRGQFYMHHFLSSQPKLNLNDPKVQGAVLEEMKFLLDKGVNGFRIDALTFANNDPQFRNNPWLDGKWPRHDESWNQQRFEHSMCQPQTVDLIARIREVMDGYPDKKTTLGETIAGPDGGWNAISIAPSYIDKDRGLDMCYTDLANGIAQKEGHGFLRDVIDRIARLFPDGGHCSSVGNHDSVRTATRVGGGAKLRQIMQLFAAMPGSICLFQGEELGLPQARIPEDIPYDKQQDPVRTGPSAARDGCRTPMPWDSAKRNAGFSESDETYLPVPRSHYELAVERQEADPNSMLNFMRDLMAWRKNQPALIKGSTKVLNTLWPLVAFVRQSREQSMLCVFNIDSKKVLFKPSDLLDEKTLQAVGLKKDDVLGVEGYGFHHNTAGGIKPAPASQARPQRGPAPAP